MKSKPQLRLREAALKKALKNKRRASKFLERAVPYALGKWIEKEEVEPRDIKACLKRIEKNRDLKRIFKRAHQVGISIFPGYRPDITPHGDVLLRWYKASDEEVIKYLEKLKH